jgi:site-specific DNA recombinase
VAKRTRKSDITYTQDRLPASRAAIYLRVSTDEQATDGYGLDVQRTRCAAMCAAKGWTVVNEYADEGISGTKDATGRPGLAAMLNAAQAGEIDAVVVLALDRLARKTRLVLELVETLTAANVAVVSCKESLDTTTPQGEFVLTIFAGLAQLERGVILERTSAGRNERGRRDGERGGRVPLGYQRIGDGVVIVEDQAAALVRRIFGLRAEGLTLRAIADRLNADGVANPHGGRRWEPATVAAILTNVEAYQGGLRADSPARWPAILN